jgi:MOSC domain-containing protein
MRVVELWRYPVKSMQGEMVDVAEVTPTGLDGDRAYAIFDVDTGFGLTARRVPELLFASARWLGDGNVAITMPDGSSTSDDDALSAWLGRRVTLRSAHTPGSRVYENPIDFEDERRTEWMAFRGAPAAFHDSATTQVSLVSRGTIGEWDRRRFRANVLVDGDGEDALVDQAIGVGDAVLMVANRIPRCVMTTRPQPGGIDRDLEVLRTINRDRGGFLAVGALVARSGTVRTGDAIETSL